jgi:hypothetical protein
MLSFKILFPLVESKDGHKQSLSKKKQIFLLRVMESIYIHYPVMENKSLQVIFILHPTPNIQSSPLSSQRLSSLHQSAVFAITQQPSHYHLHHQLTLQDIHDISHGKL